MFHEILFKPNFLKKQIGKRQDYLDFEEPQVILIQGMRGSGKSVTTEHIAERFYEKGFNIWHLWGARSFENLYWAINKNCKQNYLDYKNKEIQEINKINGTDKTIDEIDWGLHCNCDRSYPISWIIPDYVEVNQESIDRFNGVYFNDLIDYAKYCKEITPEDSKKLQENKLKKPNQFRPVPKILVRKITTPTTKNKREIFREQFIKIIIEARNQHRIVVMNPAIFDGVTDKFETMADIMNYLPELMHSSGQFMPIEEPKNKWEKNWEKVVIIINEIRSLAPSSRLSGESKAGISKKAVFDKIPELRHMKTWFIADYQNPDDLYAGVRYQANIMIIKKASRNILGDDWSWLFAKIETEQMRYFSWRFNEVLENKEELFKYKKIPEVMSFLNKYRPSVDDLEENAGYIVYPNNAIMKVTFPLPKFHHKQSGDDFMSDTGITWKTVKEKKPETKDTDTKEKTPKKKFKEIIMLRIQQWVKEKVTFQDMLPLLKKLEEDDVIPAELEYSSKTDKNLNKVFNRWLSKQR